jgi:hypothetical protein
MYGIATFIPGVARIFGRGAGDSNSARYCYSVWLRHLVMISAGRDRPASVPRVVAELGPGDSLGMGLCALLSGAEKYYAFDVVAHAPADRNLRIFDELVAMFERREPIPDDREFPEVKPRLASYQFPVEVLTDAHLAQALDRARLDRIRDSIRNPNSEGAMVRYQAPWFDDGVIQESAVDFVFSQAVLEHVADLRGAYRAVCRWLRSGGTMSHQIDFRCHNTAHDWNGHWAYSDVTWTLIKGRRSYLLNREPYSTHLKLLQENGFDVAGRQLVTSDSRLRRNDLADRFAEMTDEDRTTSGAFIHAVKR